MNPLKKLAGDTALYGISSIVGRLLNYLLVPFYTAVFATGEYGVVTKVYAFVAFLNVLYTYGLETAYFRFAAANPETEDKVYNTATTSILLSSLLFSGLMVFFATPLISAIGYEGKEQFVYWFAAILTIDAFVAIPFAQLRLRRKTWAFVGAKLGNIGINIGLNLFFIILCKGIWDGEFLPQFKSLIGTFYNPNYGIEYVFISNLIANACLLIFLSPYLARLRFKIDYETLKPMLKYAYPLLFLGLAGVTNDMLSRALFEELLPEGFYPGKTSQEALGIFGACFKLAVFMNLTVQAFRYASEPFFFARAKDKESPALFSDAMHWFVILACFILLAVSINLDIIGLLLRQPEYREGLQMVPLLLLAYLFLGVYYNLSIWFKLSDKTYFGTWITVLGAIATIILNILLVPKFGYIGSALASVGCYSLMTVVCFYFGQKYYPIPYRIWADLGYISLTLALTYLVMQVQMSSQLVATSFHFLVIVAFLLVIFLIEKRRLKSLKINES
jgi:O-antigen/teichoic acid export membrane protein